MSEITSDPNQEQPLVALRWVGDAATGILELLDQRLLPHEASWVPLNTAADVAEAIRDMVVRGAPAIGCAAAYGMVLAAQEVGASVQLDDLRETALILGSARPTAVNLNWAIERMLKRIESAGGSLAIDELFAEAEAIREEDIAANRSIGNMGAELIPEGEGAILTICNTGSLATAGYGTALGIIRSTWELGRVGRVYVSETRPYLQGARLTTWELNHDKIPNTLITDNAAGYLMAQGRIKAVVAGADRIAANGDTANKIGTYMLAVLAKRHHIPFIIAAPWSTVDLSLQYGDLITIEERAGSEVTTIGGVSIAPEDTEAVHIAFDVTPADLISAIVTERGVAQGDLGVELSIMGGECA